jgi:TPR repeat protein
MKDIYLLIVFAVAFPVLTVAQNARPTPKSTELQRKLEEQSQDDLRRAKAINLVQNTAAEAPLWGDKKMAVVVLTDAADLLWDETPGQGAKWLTKAWTLTDQVSESARNEKLKEFFTHSDKSDLRTLVLSVARTHDVQLAENFLQQLSQKEPDEKKDRGAFDDKTARSEQLLSLALRAVDVNPDLAVSLAERSLVDGLSYSLQNVLTGLRNKNTEMANRLFDLALARFSSGEPDPSEAEVLAGYLFQSGFTFSANSTGQTILAVNPAHQNLPAVAPSEPQRAKNFLIAVYQVLLARPISVDTPEGKRRGQRLLVLGQRLAGFYYRFAPEFAQPAQGFLAQLQRQLLPDGEASPSTGTNRFAATSENTTKSPTKEETYEKRLTQLEDKADREQNSIARKLAYVEAALTTKPEDYKRAKRIAEKIDDDDNLRADAVSFVLFRAALFFVEKAEIERAMEIAPEISAVSRRAVVKIAIAQRLLSSRTEKKEPGELSFAQQRAFDLLNDIERDLKNEEPSANAAKILLGRTAVLAKLDKDQALASLEQNVQMINKLAKFDLRDGAAPNLGMGAFTPSGATVAGPKIGFDFRSAIEPLIMSEFEQISAAAERLTRKELSGVARLEAAKLYLKKTRDRSLRESAGVVR